MAQELFLTIAEQSSGLCVDAHNTPLTAYDNSGIRGKFKKLPQQLFVFAYGLRRPIHDHSSAFRVDSFGYENEDPEQPDGMCTWKRTTPQESS